MPKYRIGTRKSTLAVKQAEEVIDFLRIHYRNIDFCIKGFDTRGDIDKTTPISKVEDTDFFTREIENALLRQEIDIAVHSAKDLPININSKLTIAVVTDSANLYDVLISKDDLSLEELPTNAVIGTSSKRRKRQLKKYRNDFRIVDIRGNIEERLDLLDCARSEDLHGIVIAAIGLIRLGLEDRISQYISFDIIEPHPLQGKLAVQIRKNDKGLFDLLKIMDNKKIQPYYHEIGKR